MSNAQLPTDFHWMFEIVQTIDVGLVVIDSEYSIQSWNAFMENHSGRRAASVKEQNLFEVFPELPEHWFRQKVDTVRQLNIRAFTTWEQRPYIVRFRNYHPITSLAEYMYQNTMLYPLANTNGEVEHIAIVIFNVTDVATNKMALQEANGELARLSRTDGLSQLYNRAHWEECLFKEIQRSRRHDHPLSLIILDVDHFKDINDEYGHTCGDDVIRALGREMRQNIRETDIAGRYGGEEFSLILPETNAEAALVFAERFRRHIETLRVNTENLSISFTISLGIAELHQDMDSQQAFIQAADKALYHSKETGRNRSMAYHDLPDH